MKRQSESSRSSLWKRLGRSFEFRIVFVSVERSRRKLPRRKKENCFSVQEDCCFGQWRRSFGLSNASRRFHSVASRHDSSICRGIFAGIESIEECRRSFGQDAFPSLRNDQSDSTFLRPRGLTNERTNERGGGFIRSFADEWIRIECDSFVVWWECCVRLLLLGGANCDLVNQFDESVAQFSFLCGHCCLASPIDDVEKYVEDLVESFVVERSRIQQRIDLPSSRLCSERRKISLCQTLSK